MGEGRTCRITRDTLDLGGGDLRGQEQCIKGSEEHFGAKSWSRPMGEGAGNSSVHSEEWG